MYRANWAKGPSARLAWATARCTTHESEAHPVFHGGPRRCSKGSGTGAIGAVDTN